MQFKKIWSVCWAEFALKCAHIWAARLFPSPSEKTKHILAHTGLTQSRWQLPIEVLWTEMTKTLARELSAEWQISAASSSGVGALTVSALQSGSTAKCAWTDCDESFRQAGESSISHYLAGLVGVWWRGGGFAPSLHGKPLDVYPLQLISHSQQIRHIRCCFGRGHQSG